MLHQVFFSFFLFYFFDRKLCLFFVVLSDIENVAVVSYVNGGNCLPFAETFSRIYRFQRKKKLETLKEIWVTHRCKPNSFTIKSILSTLRGCGKMRKPYKWLELPISPEAFNLKLLINLWHKWLSLARKRAHKKLIVIARMRKSIPCADKYSLFTVISIGAHSFSVEIYISVFDNKTRLEALKYSIICAAIST